MVPNPVPAAPAALALAMALVTAESAPAGARALGHTLHTEALAEPPTAPLCLTTRSPLQECPRVPPETPSPQTRASKCSLTSPSPGAKGHETGLPGSTAGETRSRSRVRSPDQGLPHRAHPVSSATREGPCCVSPTGQGGSGVREAVAPSSPGGAQAEARPLRHRSTCQLWGPGS